jgi:predicted TIM-barrel fold metal-dependent hydrolase
MQLSDLFVASLKRRDFVVRGLGSALAAGAALTEVSANEDPQLDIIDAHTHFYDPTRSEGVPWPGKNDTALYRPILPDEFRKLAQPHGVVGMIVVEASPWVEDNQWLLDLAEREKSIVGVVGHLDLSAADFAKHLRRFTQNPLYRGIRISHGTLSEGLKLNLVERCKLLVNQNLELDVNGGPEMPAQVAALASKLPELRIVINHCANVRIDGQEPPPKWREGMAAAARHARVFCKVSALPVVSDVAAFRPVLNSLWALFGEDRLLFGSNWPVSSRGEQFGVVLRLLREYFAEKGNVAARKFFRDNSESAYVCRPR